jgi:hypothetical protein
MFGSLRYSQAITDFRAPCMVLPEADSDATYLPWLYMLRQWELQLFNCKIKEEVFNKSLNRLVNLTLQSVVTPTQVPT